MKKLVLILFVAFGFLSQAQNIDTEITNGIEPSSVQKTPLLEALYEEAKQLQENPQTTVQEMELNRLSIKNAWMEVNPEIASLYKPINNGGKLPEIEENIHINGVFIPAEIKQREDHIPTRDWGPDNLLLDDWVDGGIDMEVTHQGHIYISHYKNDIVFGGPFDIIYVHRSLDGGNTFELWKTANITAPVTRAKMISIDGQASAWNYINVYFLTETNNFQLVRWGLDDGSFDANVIATEVNYFDVDRNYVNNTDAQRVFAVYDKLSAGGCHRLYSARSTAGTYGINWVDEATVQNTCSIDVGVAYSTNGHLFTSHRGQSSNFLYYNANSSSNDPASWSLRLTVDNNPNNNNKEVSIISSRDVFPNNKVYIVSNIEQPASERLLVYYLIENNVLTNGPALLLASGGIYEYRLPSLWIKRQNNVTNFSYSVGVDEIGGSGKVVVEKINEVPIEFVSDNGNEVYFGVPTAVAETIDGLPCVAFAGTSAGGNPRGLYFDAKTVLLNSSDFDTSTVMTYPNPVSEKLHISALENIDAVTMLNQLGQVVISKKALNEINTVLDVTHLNPGVYFLQIEIGQNVITKKIIKN